MLSIAHSLRLPSICMLCKQFHKNRHAVCDFCIELIPSINYKCSQCAYPLPTTQFLLCGACIKKPPHFDRSYIAFPYEEPLRGLLQEFKYQKGLYLSSLLCKLMLKALNQTDAQCLIPVPMHPIRLKQRGYNQALVLTKLLAKKLELPYDFQSCQKIVNTPPQASLDSKQRHKNLLNVFQVSDIPYEHVILVDDLLTTGATANELALTLKRKGVRRVDLWCCARTILQEKPL